MHLNHSFCPLTFSRYILIVKVISANEFNVNEVEDISYRQFLLKFFNFKQRSLLLRVFRQLISDSFILTYFPLSLALQIFF
jgi:hypothetical protein